MPQTIEIKRYIILTFSCLLAACQDKPSDEWLKIKQAKDYKLIEAFLLDNSDSEYFKEALELAVKLKDDADTIVFYSTYPNYFERNVVIIILENDSIPYVGNEVLDFKLLDNLALESLINKSDKYYLPEIKEINFNHGKNRMMISKCHFYIVVKNSIDLAIVRKVTKQLSNAIRAYKIYLLNQEIVGPKISELELLKTINENFRNRVQYFRFNKFTKLYPFHKY